MRGALGLEAGDTVRYVTSRARVQVLRTRSAHEFTGMLARDNQGFVTLYAWKKPSIEGLSRLANDITIPVSYNPRRWRVMDSEEK